MISITKNAVLTQIWVQTIIWPCAELLNIIDQFDHHLSGADSEYDSRERMRFILDFFMAN